ncbi:hypothetical protein H7F51_10565 [Novosphingobium flavum]|uniref:VanZ family protein n=1 Tax=Novosphingobium flavum TaxID=1778672 RepID=A0A7X1KLV0_9SPHN|nr:hypothetical protein [Novosphingobium flavum]MBC2665969.1 hypothetical protein [Novosphingobium flavum]
MTAERFQSWARGLFWLAMAGATTLAVMPRQPVLPTDVLGDKFNHMLAFTVMAVLAFLGWPAVSRLKVVFRLSVLGALIEVVQAIPAVHRDSDARDWVADTVAVLVVALVLGKLARRRVAAAVADAGQ